MTKPGGFTPPWYVIDVEGAFRVEDTNSFAVAYIGFTEDLEQLGERLRSLYAAG